MPTFYYYFSNFSIRQKFQSLLSDSLSKPVVVTYVRMYTELQGGFETDGALGVQQLAKL